MSSFEVSVSILLERLHELAGRRVGLHDDVHLKGHVLAVNLMFRRSVEMQLKGRVLRLPGFASRKLEIGIAIIRFRGSV